MTRRLLYAALTGATVVLGLLSRRIPALPAWLAKDAGDALYAAMVYWLVCFLAPAIAPGRALIGAIAFCFAVELSQLYHAPWIDAVRDTRLGGLVLGHGFHARDLACYVAGAALAAALDLRFRRWPRR